MFFNRKFNRAVANRLNNNRLKIKEEEHQYKEHNLFFYCRFYDIENNSIRPLHNNISKLKAKHLAICR